MNFKNKEFGYMAYPGIATELFPNKIKEIALHDIFLRVCDHMSQSAMNVRSRSRKRDLVICRQSYYYFARKYTKKSLTQIGRVVNFDHATVISGIRHINDLLDTDKSIKRQIELIDFEISQYFYKPNN